MEPVIDEARPSVGAPPTRTPSHAQGHARTRLEDRCESAARAHYQFCDMHVVKVEAALECEAQHSIHFVIYLQAYRIPYIYAEYRAAETTPYPPLDRLTGGHRRPQAR